MSEEEKLNVSILQLSYGNFVSLEDYIKLQQENKKLMQYILDAKIDMKIIMSELENVLKQLNGSDIYYE